ncbi:MAG: hypothetical protein RIE73_12280 [Coleofasciculus sp. C1-SOL-03]
MGQLELVSQKAEGRRQMAEGRRQMAEGRRLIIDASPFQPFTMS